VWIDIVEKTSSFAFSNVVISIHTHTHTKCVNLIVEGLDSR
jgi:hypothetical protein